MIEKAKGCMLCTDYTGQHDKNRCYSTFKGKKFPNCPMTEGGVICGKRHHKLVHGSMSKYCNMARVSKTSTPPTDNKIEREDESAGTSTLMKV